MKPEIHECMFCVDCFSYLANGNEPDEPNGWSVESMREGDYRVGAVPPDFDELAQETLYEVQAPEGFQADTPAVREAIAAEFRKQWEEMERDDEFSRESCDCCGSTVPGSRHAGHLVIGGD